MSFSQSSACHFVPLLARVVLGAAFISAGYSKIFRDSDFDQAEYDAVAVAPPSTDHASPVATFASWNLTQDAPPTPAGGGSGQDTGDDQDTARDNPLGEIPGEVPGTPPGDGDAETQDSGGTTAADGGRIRDRNLYNVAIRLNNSGFSEFVIPPKYLAWMVALTQLIGGVLILVGLFSRVWGLGMAIISGGAFYIMTYSGATGLGATGLGYVVTETGLNAGNFTQMFTQLSLFVLAFGIFLTGAGAISVDRMLFKSGRDQDEIDVDLT